MKATIKMKKVYIVTHDDSGVDAVCSSREKAETFMSALPVDGGYNAVYEMPVDDNKPDPIKRGYSVYEIVMLYDGKVESIDQKTRNLYLWADGDRYFIWKRSKLEWAQKAKLPDALNATVWARNERHATKIVNKIRLQIIKGGEWAKK